MPIIRRLNNAHPWNQYKATRDSLRKKLTSSSNDALWVELYTLADSPEVTSRTEAIKLLLERFDANYRRAWSEKYDIDFDDFNPKSPKHDATIERLKTILKEQDNAEKES